MIECKICGEKFEIITWNHVKKHGLNLKEYKERFPNSPIASEEFIRKSFDNIKSKSCKYCGEKFESLGSLGGHVSMNHGNGVKISKWVEKFGAWNKGLTFEEDDRIPRPWLGKKRDGVWNGGLSGEEYLSHFSEGKVWNDGLSGEEYLSHYQNGMVWNKGLGDSNPYGHEFTGELKEIIRNRDGYCCKNCKKSQEEEFKEIGRRLAVHHIDGNKKNNISKNLLTLCCSCHLDMTNKKCKEELIVCG